MFDAGVILINVPPQVSGEVFECRPSFMASEI